MVSLAISNLVIINNLTMVDLTIVGLTLISLAMIINLALYIYYILLFYPNKLTIINKPIVNLEIFII
jgi:hypothetical protein